MQEVVCRAWEAPIFIRDFLFKSMRKAFSPLANNFIIGWKVYDSEEFGVLEDRFVYNLTVKR